MVFNVTGSAESVNVKQLETLASVDGFSYYFTFEIMNRNYSDSLLDPESPAYKKMYSEVSTAVSVHFIIRNHVQTPNIKYMTHANTFCIQSCCFIDQLLIWQQV